MKSIFSFFIVLLLVLIGCSSFKNKSTEIKQTSKPLAKETQEVASTPTRNLYWGNTHLHTSFSSDAFLFGTITASPDDANRFAIGEIMVHKLFKSS